MLACPILAISSLVLAPVAAARVVLHGLDGTADLEQAFLPAHRAVGPRQAFGVGRGALVKALVQAEMLKLRSTRTPAGLLLATLALVALTVSAKVPEAGAQNPLVSLEDPRLLAVAVGTSFGVPLVLVVLLGALACTQEFRYGTATSTFLGEPRRTRVLLAKWLSQALSSLVLTPRRSPCP